MNWKSLTDRELAILLEGERFKTVPMRHQLATLAMSTALDRTFAWNDIGTGKSLVGLYAHQIWRSKRILVVCPNCVNDHKSKLLSEQMKGLRDDVELPTKPSNMKPAGWDTEDEYLSKISKQAQNLDSFRHIDDGKLQCLKCKYKFKYDRDENRPNTCPYCGLIVKISKNAF